MRKIIFLIAIFFGSFAFGQEIKKDSIYEKPQEAANLPGGINAFRNKFAENFDSSNVPAPGSYKGEITFVVEKDGSISNINAKGNNRLFLEEAIRTLKRMKVKWTPAKINGEPVRYSFKFPITMNFE